VGRLDARVAGRIAVGSQTRDSGRGSDPVALTATQGPITGSATTTVSDAAPASLVLANCVVAGTAQACSGPYRLGGNQGTLSRPRVLLILFAVYKMRPQVLILSAVYTEMP